MTSDRVLLSVRVGLEVIEATAAAVAGWMGKDIGPTDCVICMGVK